VYYCVAVLILAYAVSIFACYVCGGGLYVENV
jgi:hypothetical protein